MLYKDFIDNIENQREFKHFDGTDNWNFGGHKKTEIENRKLTSIAVNNENVLLAVNSNICINSANVFLIEEGESNFFALSLSEVYQRKKLLADNRKISKSRGSDFTEYLVKYKDCPGCLYWIASGMLTSVFDEKKYNKERNLQAVPILTRIAELEDPRACNELSSYYTLEEESPELVFKWKLKTLALGNNLDKKKLAEFIIDEKHDQVELAIKLLEEMRKATYSVDWTYWQEANIYLKGINNMKDIDKGLGLLKKAADMDFPLALVDYSYFLHKGIGVKQDKNSAMEILMRANRLSNNRYTDLINKLKHE